jgi:26S proteasome regulatory subunit N2
MMQSCGVNPPPYASKFDFTSNAKPNLFMYPSMMKLPNKVVTMVTITILSTTAKFKARERRQLPKETQWRQ